MNSIDIKSLLIGALFTAVVVLSTGWQRSVVGGTQKVEIVKWPNAGIGGVGSYSRVEKRP